MSEWDYMALDGIDPVDVTVTIESPPLTAADYACGSMTAEHDWWRQLWPDPRTRWRWLYWLARQRKHDGPDWMNPEVRQMTSPPLRIRVGDRLITTRLSGRTTPMCIIGAAQHMVGVEPAWVIHDHRSQVHRQGPRS